MESENSPLQVAHSQSVLATAADMADDNDHDSTVIIQHLSLCDHSFWAS